MSECESNNPDSRVTNEVGVGMSTRQLQDLLTNALSTLRTDIVTIIDSKLQAVTKNITAKIGQGNERLSEKLTQNLHNEVKKLSSDICTLRNYTERKFQEVTTTVGGVSDSLNERIDAHVVAPRKMTNKISQETNARAGHLVDDIKEYRTEAENSLKEFRQDYSQFREQMNSEQATWQNKAGGEIDKVKDSVRLVEDRVTEVQAAAQNSIQKVNTEITYLWGQLAARQLTDSAIPSQVLPVTAVDIENSSQSNPELANSAGNYHMGNCNANNCSTTVCGNAISQPCVNNNSGYAIVNVSSDVFANNSTMNELALPDFHDSSKQIVIHFLRDFDEYYRIKNDPEPETIGDKVMKAYAKMRKKGKYRRERRKTRGTKVKERVLVRAQPASDAVVGVTAKFVHPYEGPYIISRVIPPYELLATCGKVRGEFDKKSPKAYLEEETSDTVGSN